MGGSRIEETSVEDLKVEERSTESACPLLSVSEGEEEEDRGCFFPDIGVGVCCWACENIWGSTSSRPGLVRLSQCHIYIKITLNNRGTQTVPKFRTDQSRDSRRNESGACAHWLDHLTKLFCSGISPLNCSSPGSCLQLVVLFLHSTGIEAAGLIAY